MAIPDYQTLMLPLLQMTRDGNDHVVSNIVDVLADLFSLTEDERKEMLQSGAQTKFRNRVAWARSYLVKAGLLIGSVHGGVDEILETQDTASRNYCRFSREELREHLILFL